MSLSSYSLQRIQEINKVSVTQNLSRFGHCMVISFEGGVRCFSFISRAARDLIARIVVGENSTNCLCYLSLDYFGHEKLPIICNKSTTTI